LAAHLDGKRIAPPASMQADKPQAAANHALKVPIVAVEQVNTPTGASRLEVALAA
jgi:hypothetical protein